MMISSLSLHRFNVQRPPKVQSLRQHRRTVTIPRASSIQPLGVPLESWAHAFTFGVFVYTSLNYIHYRNLVKKVEDDKNPKKKK